VANHSNPFCALMVAPRYVPENDGVERPVDEVNRTRGGVSRSDSSCDRFAALLLTIPKSFRLVASRVLVVNNETCFEPRADVPALRGALGTCLRIRSNGSGWVEPHCNAPRHFGPAPSFLSSKRPTAVPRARTFDAFRPVALRPNGE
jgi:hypothetical protein